MAFLPDDFDPPVSIPDKFEYSIRAYPACIEFPQFPQKDESVDEKEKKKTNKSTKLTRTFYKWIKDNNITEEGHRLILPWGQTVEEFAINTINSQYEKRDFVKKRR